MHVGLSPAFSSSAVPMVKRKKIIKLVDPLPSRSLQSGVCSVGGVGAEIATSKYNQVVEAVKASSVLDRSGSRSSEAAPPVMGEQTGALLNLSSNCSSRELKLLC